MDISVEKLLDSIEERDDYDWVIRLGSLTFDFSPTEGGGIVLTMYNEKGHFVDIIVREDLSVIHG